MVRKCCVPDCTSSSRIPNHRLPSEDLKAQAWLEAIGLNIESKFKTFQTGMFLCCSHKGINYIKILYFVVTDITKEERAKLRICTLHFPDTMIMPYGQKRRLMHNAIPTLHLSKATIAEDCVSTASADIDTIAALESAENVEDNFNFAPAVCKPVNVHTIVTADVMRLREKVKRYRKRLNKKRSAQQARKLRRQNHVCKKQQETWDNITANLPSIQRIFLDMIHSNFKRAPQVCEYCF